MPASTIWPHPSTINNPGGHETFGRPTQLIIPTKNGVPLVLLWNLAPSLNILQSFVFSRENYMLSSVLSVHVLSCYITCIAHTFHINGI